MSTTESNGKFQWGDYRMVDPRLIVVDHTFQREQKTSVIEAVAANPDPRAFGVPVVFERDNGVLYCADGQQRIAGILACETPPRQIPVVAFKLGSVKDEAHVFYLINVFRKGLTPLEKHKGAVVAQHPANVAVQKIVESLGFGIGTSRSGSGKQIGAISGLMAIYNAYGELVLRDTLVLVSSAWPNDPKAFDTHLLRAVGRAVAESHTDPNANYERQKTQAAFTRTTPANIMRKAEEIHFEQGTTKRESLRRAIYALTKF